MTQTTGIRRDFLHEVAEIGNTLTMGLGLAALVACLFVNAVAGKDDGEWLGELTGLSTSACLDIETGAALGAVAIAVAILVWGSYLFIACRRVTPMKPRNAFILHTVTRLLIFTWLLIASDYIIACIWLPFLIYQTIRQYRALTPPIMRSLKEARTGKVYGPFSSTEELMEDLLK